MIARVVLEQLDPDQIAEVGSKIYGEQFQSECELHYSGQILAIDIETQRAFASYSLRESGHQARRAGSSTLCFFKKVGTAATLHQR